MQLNEKRLNIIESWMFTIIQDDGVERYDDLHIDDIDDAWKLKDLWIPGGVAVFQLAIELKDAHKLDFSIGLGFSLVGSKHLIGIDFQTEKDLAARLDWTPPSLYLFKPWDEPHRNLPQAVREGKINADYYLQPIHIFESLSLNANCNYMEFLISDDEDYRRSIFITA